VHRAELVPSHLNNQSDRQNASEPPAYEQWTGMGAPPGLFMSLPHSGRYYPPSFLEQTRFTAQTIRVTEDAYVDELIGFGDELGLYAQRGVYGRAYIDLNRDPLELDGRLITDRLPKTALSGSARVLHGFGVVPRCLKPGQDIYIKGLKLAEVQARLIAIHAPYHRALQALCQQARGVNGHVLWLDWHSGPSSAFLLSGKKQSDVVIGDFNGQACDKGLRDRVKSIFERNGFVVALNQPFAGGYTTQYYGRPEHKQHVLQIEINRSLYLDEAQIVKTEGFAGLKAKLKAVIEELKSLVRPIS